ncbi:MAG TPA: ribonuclease III [Bryobacteraceae bacterium]|nr:ribonuclease III [Bryobacteraceae bacterium]
MHAPRAETLEAVLGYRFLNPELLERALTHKSRAYERGADPTLSDNEQLEFLGDSILGFVVSEKLVALYPNSPEGRLSKLKAHLVSASHLFQVADGLKLGEFLLLGRGEEMSGGREKKALLSNAVEALIAAVYLDGGMEPAREFVSKNIFGEFHTAEQALGAVPDHKSALQEMAQSLKLPQPRYTILEERGPQHAKTFLVEARVGREWVSQAEGLSKKSAGQKAAQDVLRQLREISG